MRRLDGSGTRKPPDQQKAEITDCAPNRQLVEPHQHVDHAHIYRDEHVNGLAYKRNRQERDPTLPEPHRGHGVGRMHKLLYGFEHYRFVQAVDAQCPQIIDKAKSRRSDAQRTV